jgi:hypothetical protein
MMAASLMHYSIMELIPFLLTWRTVLAAKRADIPCGTILVPKCLKKKYMTEEAAQLRLCQIREIERLGGRKRPEKYSYKCKNPDCGFWHLTKQEPWGGTS